MQSKINISHIVIETNFIQNIFVSFDDKKVNCMNELQILYE
jgi:hypothetical protein